MARLSSPAPDPAPLVETGAQVWLVEDSPLEAQRTLSLLSGQYTVVHFPEAASMLERLNGAVPPDLLLLDWQLPGVSGLEALRFVREQYDEVALPVLMITSRGAREDVREGLAAGANDYVAKPYDDVALLARVRTLVRVRRAFARAEDALSRAALARRELERERTHLRELFAIAPAIVGVTRGPEHRYALVNPLHQRVIGGVRPLLGRTVREAVPEVAEQGILARLDEVYRTGVPYEGSEVPLRLDRHGDGRLEDAWFTFVYQPTRDVDGKVDGVATFGFEVTAHVLARRELEAIALALRASEERLQLVVDAIPALIAFIDVEQRYVLGNEAYRSWFGVDPASLPGRRISEVLGPESYRGVLPYVQRALAGEAVRFETPFVFGGGRRGHLQAAYVPYRGEGGRVLGYVAIGWDMTREHEVRESLRQQADFERQLIGIVSHDLRNPLHGIQLSAATMLRRPGLDERHAVIAQRILATSERMARMIRDLLDFTRARRGGGLSLEPAPLDLHALATQGVDEVLLTHPERQVERVAEGDGRGSWDADRLAQLLSNLLVNALAYSPPDSRVSVLTRGEGDHVLLQVHNWGEPIPPDQLQRMFQPFERGENKVNDAGRSIGLGLFIVLGIARAHGGQVEVESSAAEGTTFRVRLPRSPLPLGEG
ncbi:response regulator [Aggregicoccus sp. 17bor-14]|uniref:hybrid sensor histidine kinase/response regulator n=1 Tax=Myxococcaceae TaxID=31 RepID=UPI00129C169C|nr:MULTISPECIES: PAS domain-containing protein [Myxococcaceae]MBF5043911.1 PAS domain-containing protein [Simulacricoccus sp. 17bor-14]MRI89662.1 response regulator [Aggregicoccus sp. 17bor-14]